MMRITKFLSIVLLMGVFTLVGATDFESIIFQDTFDGDGALPVEWTEYNTSGQVIVAGGQMKLDYTADHPSTYRSFDAESGKLTLSFDVQSSRNHVTSKMHLVSSTGQYIGSIVFGNADAFSIQYATSLDAGEPAGYEGALISGAYAKNKVYTISVNIDFDEQTLSFIEGGVARASGIPFIDAATDFGRIDISQLYMFNNEGQFYFDNITLGNTYIKEECATNHFSDNFSVDLPSEWIEYNTTDSVSVADGWMKFAYSTKETPTSAYRTFTPIASPGYLTLSFDMKSSRNYVLAKMNLLSSTGKYIASISFGNNATKNIQYATSMVGSEPSAYDGALLNGAYASNTTYSVSVTMSISEQTIDFYNDGVLMASDIPFLESSVDISKIDIAQLEMFNNEGQFYFDNIMLDEEDIDRANLSTAISAVDASTYSLVISPLYGYTEENYNALLAAQEDAEMYLDNCDATQEQMDSVAAELLVALANFEDTFQDEVVCTFYTDAQLSGAVLPLNCGYYNGVLGAFDNKAVSFHLEKGYMLTVAQNVNGSGVSKVYVAIDEALELNFPAELQKSITFARVGPWRDVDKRGASGKGNDVVQALTSTWFYDWGKSDLSTTACEYVVMDWSGGASLDKMTALGNTMDITHHLAFNEPDGEDQSNMTVDNAIAKYEILQASGLRLGAPAVTDGAKGRTWLDEFMVKADAAGYRIDYLPVHYYKKQTANNFYKWIKDLYDTYGLPIWVTEFHYGSIWNADDLSESAVLAGLTAYCNMLDETSFVERYCVFTWQPTSTHSLMSVRNPVTLNSVGEFYANHETPLAYSQETYENGPDNPASIAGLTSVGNVQAYPNPVVGGKLNIDYSDINTKDAVVKMYDLSGQLVYSQGGSPQEIEVLNYPSGLYMMQISTEEGLLNYKIMVKN